VNSLASLKVKLHPSIRTKGRMGIKSKKGMVGKGAQSTSTTTTSTYAIKRCYALEILPYHFKGITKNVS